jgi:hypothetical protein
MSSLSELHIWTSRKVEVPPTPREAAERWIRALSGSEPVEVAQADAEVDFRKKERTGNWRDSIGKVGFVPEPKHWPAGAEYARRMFAGYAQAAFAHIRKPQEFESFLHESLAILSERTYRQKLRPYEHVAGAESEARVIASFHGFVRGTASDDVSHWAFAGWERHRERCRRKLARTVNTAGEITSRVESAAGQPVTAELAPAGLSTETPSVQPEEAVSTAPNGSGIAEARETRLQDFIRAHNATIAAVCRAARVAKAEMQRWRKGQLKSTSVMTRRIEDVLSGKTPLPREMEG